jgi:hypothetical protein
LVVPLSLFAIAPPAAADTGFQSGVGAASVVATPDTYGMLPFPAVPVNISFALEENVLSSQDSKVGVAERAWLNTTLKTFCEEELFDAPATFDGTLID